MSDVYIENRHGVVHSIPESMLPQAEAQGAKKITKAAYEKALKGEAEPEPEDKGKAKK